VTITVVAAIIRRDERILITRRFDNVHLPGLWEFPGGKVEPGESLPAALQREIREELGVEITVGEQFFETEHSYPAKTVRLHFFHSSISHGEPSALEVADLRWIMPAELTEFEFPAADAELIARLRV
jgi:mutator protein MutT